VGAPEPGDDLEKYNRFVPNLTWTDGKALLATNEKAKRSGGA
jgi:hypothetical protein